jgi:hypothetical protein
MMIFKPKQARINIKAKLHLKYKQLLWLIKKIRAVLDILMKN